MKVEKYQLKSKGTMLKDEFDKRIGRESAMEEYCEANSLYMAIGHDKDVFCRLWKVESRDILFGEVQRLWHEQQELVARLQQRVDEMNEAERALGVVLMETSKWCAKDVKERLENAARQLLGLRRFIIMKCEKVLEKTSFEYLQQHLSEKEVEA